MRRESKLDSQHGTLNGYNYYRCRCLRCLRAMSDYHRKNSKRPAYRKSRKERESARRAEIQRLKLDSQCMDCDEITEDPAMLHFDHRDPSSKLFDVGRGITLSKARLDAEIEKCDIVCNSCHARRSIERGQMSPYGNENRHAT